MDMNELADNYDIIVLCDDAEKDLKNTQYLVEKYWFFVLE